MFYQLGDTIPQTAEQVFVADNATVIGTYRAWISTDAWPRRDHRPQGDVARLSGG